MSQTMQKLNTMGQTPNSGGNQIVNVTYGHHGSGKLYSYYGSNKRTGDIVTPEVTHPKTGKTYKTLAVVRSTHSVPQGQNTVILRTEISILRPLERLIRNHFLVIMKVGIRMLKQLMTLE